jgi:hypothetical protein
MIGFDGRHQWRQHQLFKLCAKPPQRKKLQYYNWLPVWMIIARWRRSAAKICDSLICCAAHNK